MFGIDDMLMGGLSMAGGLFAQDQTNQRQADAQAFNAGESALNRDFQERMSSTAYQRSMTDMKSAGLNPILAYQKGGASSPTGSMASTNYTPANDVVGPAVSSAMQHNRLKNEVENMQATNANLKLDAANKWVENSKLRSEDEKIKADRDNVIAETAIRKEQLPVHSAHRVQAEIDKGLYETGPGRIARQAGTYGSEAQRASSAFGNFMNPVKTFNQLWKDRTDRGF